MSPTYFGYTHFGYTYCGYAYYGYTHYGYTYYGSAYCGYAYCGYAYCGYAHYGHTYFGHIYICLPGELELPESGLLAGGRVRTIRRHPSFRLLLTVDPSRGELSRAMRNRGVEVAVDPPPTHSADMLRLLRARLGGDGAAPALL